MAMEHDRKVLESIAEKKIGGHLMPILAGLDELESLLNRGLDAIADHANPMSAAKVGLILISRLNNDVRVCRIAAERGYGIQALGLSASVLETVGALAHVGMDDARACEWAEHSDLKHSYPSRVSEGIDSTLIALGINDPRARDNWKNVHREMCMAKHVNPRLSLYQGLRIIDDNALFVRGPDASDLGVACAAQALWYTSHFGIFGMSIALDHCVEERLRKEVRADAYRIHRQLHGLEKWYLEVINAAPLEAQAAALSEEALRLQSESVHLSEVTERMNMETERLRRETERARRDTPR